MKKSIIVMTKFEITCLRCPIWNMIARNTPNAKKTIDSTW